MSVGDAIAFWKEPETGRLCQWLCSRVTPQDDGDKHYFCTDDILVYDPYYGDFGPLNIAQLCRYARLMEAKLHDKELAGKSIIHVCKPQTDTRANSILLASAWLLISKRKPTPAEAYQVFTNVKPALVPYRDASLGPPSYPLTVEMCLRGLAKAISLKWYQHDSFNPDEYEHYERVENGDFNWIVPGKFLAFSGPTQTPIAYVDGVKTNTPETYYEYFRANNITGVVRFNNKVYDRKKFLDAKFNHYDLYFADGGNPTEAIMKRFMEIAEAEPGALAVHCKAGLGRTGTLISLYLMKHFGVTTPEVIGWLRLCRPGSVIGPQQNFLAEKEKHMHNLGNEHRRASGERLESLPDDLQAASLGGSPSRKLGGGPASPNVRTGNKTNGFGVATRPTAPPPAGTRVGGAVPGSPAKKPAGGLFAAKR